MIKFKNLFLVIFSITSINHLAAQSPYYDLVIKNITIIDITGGKPISGQNVYISGDRIVKITSTSKNNDNASTTVDGSGKFLIPGLWDMHTHNWWSLHFSNHYVTNGVLGVRNMYTPMNFITPLRDSINKKLIIGPKYYAAGRVLEGQKPDYQDWIVVDSLHKIKPALDLLQSEGSDFVKVYNKIPREVYFELIQEANRRGMSVQGHLPMAIKAEEASNAGQKSFEHLLGIPDLCTHDQLFQNNHGFNWYTSVLQEDDYGKIFIDEKLAKKTFSTLRKNQTFVCPTLCVWYNLLHPDTPFEDNPLLKKFPKEMTDFWKGTMGSFRKRDDKYKQMAKKKYENLKKVTYLLYKNRVPLLAGTDAVNPYCYPGYSLHKEFELLKECGIPDAQILKMATKNPAAFLGLNNYGEIKEGFVASLVLLDENPLNDISNTQKIFSVIVNGKVIEKQELLAMQE
jgi:imidazolonepropionase-like amidohydrolase